MKFKSSLAAARTRRFTTLQKLSFAVLASSALLVARAARAQQAYTDSGATSVFSTAITPTITADTSAANGDSLTFNNTATSSQTDDLTTALNFNVLTFSNTAALTLLQGAGTTITLGSTTGGTAPTVNLNNTGTVANGLNMVLANNTTFAGTGSATFSGVVSGAGSLTQAGSGTLTLSGTNSYSGGTFVTGGILAVTSDSNLGSTAASNLITLNGGALQGGGGQNGVSVNISANHGVVIGAAGGTLTTNGGDFGHGIVFNTANTLSGSGNLTITGDNASSNNTILVGAAQNLTGSIFLEDRIQLTDAAATLGTGAITIAGGTAIGTGTTFGTAKNGQLFFTAGSGTTTLANALNLNGNGNDGYGAIRGNNSQTLNGNLTLQSNSNISDSGTNTTTINGTTTGAFTLNLGGSNGSSNSANYILNGADSANATSINNGSLTLGTSTAAQGTQLTGGGSGTVKFVTGVGTFFAGSLGGSEAIGLADTGGTAVTLSVGASQTYSGTLTGGAGSALTYTGSGEAHFQANATGFTGAINVNTTGGGKLDVNTSLGSGGTYNVASGATLFVFGGTIANNTINLSGGGNSEPLGALRLDGGNIDATSTINLLTNTSIGGNGGTATIAGVIAGTAGFSKAGGDTLILGGANTFSGSTTLNGSTINLSNALALQNSTFIYNGGTLVFDASVTGNAFTFGGLSGGTSLALLNNAATPAPISLTVGGNNADTTYSGVLSGTGSNFTKVGTGTFTLNTAATLTGNFTIGNGILSLNNNNQLTAGPVIFGTAGAANNTVLTFSQNPRTFANAISTQGTGGTNTLQSQGGGQNFTFTGGFTLGNNLTFSTFGGSDSITVQTGAIGGTGNLVTNVTTVSAGGGAGAAGTTGSSGGTISLNSAINNVGTITNNGNGTSAVTINGAIGSNVTSVIQNSATSQLIINNGSGAGSGTLQVQNGLVSAGGNFFTDSTGAGTVTLGAAGAANNTGIFFSVFSRTFNNPIVTQGTGGTNTIQAQGGGQAFTLAGGVTLGNNLTLRTYGGSDTLTETGNVIGTGNLVTNVSTTGIDGSTGAGSGGNITFNGSVNHTGTLSNIGNGTSAVTINGVIGSNVTGVIQNSATSPLTLNNTNTYTGPTMVSAGTLLVNGNNGGATGPVSVASGGTLGGTGSLGGAVTVNGNITGATNGTIGALTLVNALTINGVYLVDIATGINNSDRLTLSGAGANGLLTLGSGSALTLSTTALDGTSTYVLAIYASISGQFTTTNVPSNYQLTYNSMELDLTPLGAVPEPATWLGGALCVGVFGWSLRRRMTGSVRNRQAA